MSVVLQIEKFVDSNGTLVAVGVGAIIVISVIIKYLFGSKNMEDKLGEDREETNVKASNCADKLEKQAPQIARAQNRRNHTSSVSVASPCVVNSFKGHGETVSDFDLSPNGCLMASVSPDRVLFLWSFDSVDQKAEKQFSRINVELDEAMHVSFSPDSKAFVTSLKSENAIQVWKVSKKQPETNPPKMTATPFVKYETHISNIQTMVGCAVSASGKFIATFTDDSVLKIWSLKGQLLHSLETRQGVGAGLAVSPAGCLVATYGFTSEVRVFEVLFDNNGNFTDVKRAFELGGHHTGMVGTAFDRENKRMVSVSKDGVWRLFNIDVEFRRNQDPKLICCGKLPADAINKENSWPIACGISVNSVILGTDHSLYTFDASADNAGKMVRVDDLSQAASSGHISRLRLDATGEFALVAAGKVVIVCCLYGELKLRLKTANENVKSAKGALAERLNQQISSLTSKLAAIDH